MSSDASSPNMPPEITDYIIDYLHDDKESLAACSVVAHYWLPAARHHLMPKIIVGPKNADTLLELLDAPHSTLTALITELAILASLDEAIGSLRTSQLLNFTKKFSRLTSLMIVGLNLEILDSPHWLDHLGTSGITKLLLAHCNFSSNDQFAALISSFKALEQFFCLRTDHCRASSSAVSTFSPSLRELSIIEGPLESTRWWAAQPLPPSLQAISIDEISVSKDFKDINSLMVRAASLRSLRITMADFYGEKEAQDILPSLNFSSCPSLETLTIGLRCLHEGKTLSFLPSLLAPASSSSSSLSQIKLVISLDPQKLKDLQNIPWKDLDEIFAGTDTSVASSSPNTIVIDLLNEDYDDDDLRVSIIFDKEDREKMDKIICEGLERTAKCGKLEVRYPADPPLPQFMIDVFVKLDEMYPS